MPLDHAPKFGGVEEGTFMGKIKDINSASGEIQNKKNRNSNSLATVRLLITKEVVPFHTARYKSILLYTHKYIYSTGIEGNNPDPTVLNDQDSADFVRQLHSSG